MRYGNLLPREHDGDAVRRQPVANNLRRALRGERPPGHAVVVQRVHDVRTHLHIYQTANGVESRHDKHVGVLEASRGACSRWRGRSSPQTSALGELLAYGLSKPGSSVQRHARPPTLRVRSCAACYSCLQKIGPRNHVSRGSRSTRCFTEAYTCKQKAGVSLSSLWVATACDVAG